MRCINCYQEIPDNSKFCPQCGAKQPVQKMEPVSQVNEDTTTGSEQPEAEPQKEEAQPEANSYQQDVQQNWQEAPQQNTQQNWQEAPQQDTQENPYGTPNNYQYGQGYQGYQQQNQGNQQGYYQQNNFNGMQPKPVNWVPYLILSILSTLCCCLPFGVVGIVFSAKINSSMAAGNLEEAQKNAKMARIWIIVSFVLGILTWVIYMMLIVTGAISGSAYYYY